MPVRYVDQVQKLNIRSMMAAALKAGPREQYTVCQDASGWHSVAAARPGHEIIAPHHTQPTAGQGRLTAVGCSRDAQRGWTRWPLPRAGALARCDADQAGAVAVDCPLPL